MNWTELLQNKWKNCFFFSCTSRKYLFWGAEVSDTYCLRKSTDFYNILSFVDSYRGICLPRWFGLGCTMTQQMMKCPFLWLSERDIHQHGLVGQWQRALHSLLSSWLLKLTTPAQWLSVHCRRYKKESKNLERTGISVPQRSEGLDLDACSFSEFGSEIGRDGVLEKNSASGIMTHHWRISLGGKGHVLQPVRRKSPLSAHSTKSCRI